MIVGGEILGIDATSLFVTGVFMNAYWIVAVVAGIAGVAFGVLKFGGRQTGQH